MTTTITESAAVRLTINYPFWSELFYSMEVRETTPEQSKQIQTAATDGKLLWINRAFYAPLPREEQTKILIHELGHKMFLHPQRMGSREPELWNIACDLAINNLMIENKFGLDNTWLQDPQYNGWLAEAIYSDLIAKRRKGQPIPGMPAHLLDIVRPVTSDPSKDEQTVQIVVDRAIANAHARGDLPQGIEMAVQRAFRPVGETWYNHLHRYMQAITNSTYNWAKLNRRTLRSHGIFSPLHECEAMGDVLFFIDASGSCFRAAQQAKFADHVNAIMSECRPQRVVVYYFDTKCYPPEESEPGSMEVTLKPRGGGGTDFRGLFEQAEKDGHQPTVAIVLTDMEGLFPDRAPDYPVIWADVIGGNKAPFGEYLVVEN